MITSINQVKNFFQIISPFLFPPSASKVWDHWDKNFKRPKPKGSHCVHLETPEEMPLIFTQATTRRLAGIIPVLEGHQCFCTEAKCGIPYHQQSKLLAGSAAISIYQIEHNILTDIKERRAKPIVRIHFDRRNEFAEKCICDFALPHKNPTPREIQPGPLFHMQWGGKSSLDYPLDVPRIPSCPWDFVLLADLILRNFYPRHEVSKILEGIGWNSLIKESYQRLVLPWTEESGNYGNNIFFG